MTVYTPVRVEPRARGGQPPVWRVILRAKDGRETPCGHTHLTEGAAADCRRRWGRGRPR